MTKSKAVSVPRLKPGARTKFLAHLSETANVSESARVSGVNKSSAYRERRESAEFRINWAIALCEGYARLEAELLSDALTAATGKTSDATLKARAQKDRLRLALLAMHRSSVKIAPVAAVAVSHEVRITPAYFMEKLFGKRNTSIPSKTVH
jgi:hypothetical protein